MLPQVDFFGTNVTRLILGDNPFNGHSYIPEISPRDDMLDYYTADNAVKAMFEAEKAGIDTMMPLANDFMIRVIRQYRNQGGKMNIIFQPYPAISLNINIKMMIETKPISIYHRGTDTDLLLETDRKAELIDNIKLIRDSGVAVGLGTHVPEHMMMAEEENWDIDFYVSCLYNARRDKRGEESGFLTGKEKHLEFYPDDRFLMLDTIKKVTKPCIAFKIFAGGQIFYDKTPDGIRQAVHTAFKETYDTVKDCDIACMGVYQEHKNQIKENAEIVKNILKA